MKAVFIFSIMAVFSGCDTLETLDSEAQAWLEESKAQREILQKEREDLEDKKKRLIVN